MGRDGDGLGWRDHAPARARLSGHANINILRATVQQQRFDRLASAFHNLDDAVIDLEQHRLIPPDAAVEKLGAVLRFDDIRLLLARKIHVRPRRRIDHDVRAVHDDLRLSVFGRTIVQEPVGPQGVGPAGCQIKLDLRAPDQRIAGQRRLQVPDHHAVGPETDVADRIVRTPFAEV